MEKVAENRSPLPSKFGFYWGIISAPLSKIPSEMHYMNNKILRNRNLRNYPLDMIYILYSFLSLHVSGKWNNYKLMNERTNLQQQSNKQNRLWLQLIVLGLGHLKKKLDVMLL